MTSIQPHVSAVATQPDTAKSIPAAPDSASGSSLAGGDESTAEINRIWENMPKLNAFLAEIESTDKFLEINDVKTNPVGVAESLLFAKFEALTTPIQFEKYLVLYKSKRVKLHPDKHYGDELRYKTLFQELTTQQTEFFKLVSLTSELLYLARLPKHIQSINPRQASNPKPSTPPPSEKEYVNGTWAEKKKIKALNDTLISLGFTDDLFWYVDETHTAVEAFEQYMRLQSKNNVQMYMNAIDKMIVGLVPGNETRLADLQLLKDTLAANIDAAYLLFLMETSHQKRSQKQKDERAAAAALPTSPPRSPIYKPGVSPASMATNLTTLTDEIAIVNNTIGAHTGRLTAIEAESLLQAGRITQSSTDLDAKVAALKADLTAANVAQDAHVNTSIAANTARIDTTDANIVAQVHTLTHSIVQSSTHDATELAKLKAELNAGNVAQYANFSTSIDAHAARLDATDANIVAKVNTLTQSITDLSTDQDVKQAALKAELVRGNTSQDAHVNTSITAITTRLDATDASIKAQVGILTQSITQSSTDLDAKVAALKAELLAANGDQDAALALFQKRVDTVMNSLVTSTGQSGTPTVDFSGLATTDEVSAAEARFTALLKTFSDRIQIQVEQSGNGQDDLQLAGLQTSTRTIEAHNHMSIGSIQIFAIVKPAQWIEQQPTNRPIAVFLRRDSGDHAYDSQDIFTTHPDNIINGEYTWVNTYLTPVGKGARRRNLSVITTASNSINFCIKHMQRSHTLVISGNLHLLEELTEEIFSHSSKKYLKVVFFVNHTVVAADFRAAMFLKGKNKIDTVFDFSTAEDYAKSK